MKTIIKSVMILLGVVVVMVTGASLSQAGDTYSGVSVYGGTASALVAMEPEVEGSLVLVNYIAGMYVTSDLSLGMEIGLGQYTIDNQGSNCDAFTSQFKLNAMYDVFNVKTWNVYGEAGVGLAYVSRTSDVSVFNNTHAPGIYQLGIGARCSSYVVGVRFAHVSGITAHNESGFDTIGLHVAYLF